MIDFAVGMALIARVVTFVDAVRAPRWREVAASAGSLGNAVRVSRSCREHRAT
jgi:hypothetical protein